MYCIVAQKKRVTGGNLGSACDCKRYGGRGNLILSAFPQGVSSKEILVLVNQVWELGYQAGTAEMLEYEWERL